MYQKIQYWDYSTKHQEKQIQGGKLISQIDEVAMNAKREKMNS